MKEFLKFTLATVVGIIITSFIGFLFLMLLIGIIASSTSKKTTFLHEKSVYEIRLEGNLLERSEDNPLANAFGSLSKRSQKFETGLDDLLSNIQKAKTNDNISGIFLNGGTLNAGYASLKEIRDALLDFKKSGKFIVAYADVYSQKNYFLASVADKVYVNPVGTLELMGISAQTAFFKNTLDKLGVEMQIVRVGSFKSAVEPFTNTKMSPENKLQMETLTRSIWNTVVSEISKSRKVPVDSLNSFADNLAVIQNVENGTKYKLVDGLYYRSQVDSILKNQLKISDKNEDIHFVSTSELIATSAAAKSEMNKIAVLYAVGEITDVDGDGIVYPEMVKNIQELAKDSSVKAVVLRVNSPGGSAYASEQIWYELSQLKKHKPLIVSMGDYAASGGYYISCLANKIVAQPNTLTGSIGIFALIPNISKLDEKIGISFDGVKTNKMSDAISINRPLSGEERLVLQTLINQGYELFVKRCAAGRQMTVEQIKNIAEGRVWSGEDGLRVGLVDKLGNLNDAIELASKTARLNAYNVKYYPEKQDFTAKFLKSLSKDVETNLAKANLGENYFIYKKIKDLNKVSGLQTRMDFDLILR